MLCKLVTNREYKIYKGSFWSRYIGSQCEMAFERLYYDRILFENFVVRMFCVNGAVARV